MNFTTTNVSPSIAANDLISPDASLEFKTIKIIIYVAIFVLTIVGNVLVITVIRNDKKMRGSSHMLILNLALCDLVTPTISIPFDLAYEEIKYAWPFGGIMCKILWPGQTFTTTSSALILTAICIDRYRALVYPFKVRWAGRFCVMVFSLYTFALAIVVPYMLVLHLDERTEKTDCSEKWPSPQKSFRQAYTIVLFLSQYALPLVVMITLYSITLCSLFKTSKQFLSETSKTKNESGIHLRRKRCQPQQSIKALRREQHLKVTKMFIVVVIVFAVSMFPNQVLWLWVDFGNLVNHKYFPMISIICRIFTYSNSVLNPFIYGLYSKEFRSGYKMAGRKISKGSKRPQQAFYHHFKETGKNQSSIISRSGGIFHEENLINRNADTFQGLNPVQSVSEKKHNTLEEGSEEKGGRKRLHEQNVLKDVLFVVGQPMIHMTSTGKAQIPVLDSTEVSAQSPEHQNTLTTLASDGDEHEMEEGSVENADLFISDHQIVNDCDEVTKILKSIKQQEPPKIKLTEYLEELSETQC